MDTILAGHYQLVRPLGSGGFGQTFLARDSHLPGSPLCVVKQLKLVQSNPAKLKIAKRLFNSEAQILYKLGNHDQIPRLLAHFEQEGEFYLVQEYIEGQLLESELAGGQQFDQSDVLRLLQDILFPLAFVHQQNAIHRDLKPTNLIRRDRDKKIVLIDFGAVKEVKTQVENAAGDTDLTIAIGSPGYMPCEQQAYKPHFSSDIYAVGMLGLQALTGLSPKKFPRDAQTGEFCWRELKSEIAIDPGFAAFLGKMVRYDYRQRYSTATEALQALNELLTSEESAFENLAPLSLSPVSPQTSQTTGDSSFSTVVAPPTPSPNSPKASRYLSRITPPSNLRGQRTLAAIAFTDVVGFSARMSADEERTLDLLRRDLQMMKELCEQFDGQAIKSTGDGLLMYFESAVQAVDCAVNIQTAFGLRAVEFPPEDVLLHRIGVHLGDVFVTETDVMGNGVNIAARLEGKATTGGICLSQTIYDVVKNYLPLNATYAGPIALKNIKEAVSVYQISSDALVEQRKVGSPLAEVADAVRPSFSPEEEEPAYPVLEPSFLERCRRELARCVGPMADFLLEDALLENPRATPQELVEILAAEIPNSQKAQEFQQFLL